MAFVKPIMIITKKAGKIQSVLSQNFKFYTSYPLRVYLKVNSLYQIIVFYANLFLYGHIFLLGYPYITVSTIQGAKIKYENVRNLKNNL